MPSPAALSSALLLLAALLLSPAVAAFTPLQPDDGQRDTLREIVRELDKRHYRKLELDDRFAAELLELYVKRLDPARNYLLAGDLAEFAPCRSRFDDELRAAALDCAYRIYNRFGERLRNRLEANLARLESDAEFDFEVDESLPLDTDKGPWLADAAAADEYWRLRLKKEAAGDSPAGARIFGVEGLDVEQLGTVSFVMDSGACGGGPVFALSYDTDGDRKGDGNAAGGCAGGAGTESWDPVAAGVPAGADVVSLDLTFAGAGATVEVDDITVAGITVTDFNTFRAA